MRCTERVVDIQVDAVDEVGDKRWIVALFARMEPKVLHQLDTRGQLGEALAHRGHAVLRLGATLGSTEMACAHHGCPALGEPIDGG